MNGQNKLDTILATSDLECPVPVDYVSGSRGANSRLRLWSTTLLSTPTPVKRACIRLWQHHMKLKTRRLYGCPQRTHGHSEPLVLGFSQDRHASYSGRAHDSLSRLGMSGNMKYTRNSRSALAADPLPSCLWRNSRVEALGQLREWILYGHFGNSCVTVPRLPHPLPAPLCYVHKMFHAAHPRLYIIARRKGDASARRRRA